MVVQTPQQMQPLLALNWVKPQLRQRYLRRPETYSTTAVQSSDVGDYTISATGGTATNYRFRYENNGKLTINKAELTVTTNNATRVYGGADPYLDVQPLLALNWVKPQQLRPALSPQTRLTAPQPFESERCG